MDAKQFWERALKTASKDINPLDFIVLMAIEKLADNEVGYCFAGNESIGDRLGRHESTISKSISKLVKAKLIYKIEIRQGTMVEERRLYPESQYKLYEEDCKRSLIKTINLKLDDETSLIVNERSTGTEKVKASIKKKGENKKKQEEKKEKDQREFIRAKFLEYGHKVNEGTITNVINNKVKIARLNEILVWAKANNQGIGSIVNVILGRAAMDIKQDKSSPSSQRALSGSHKVYSGRREEENQEIAEDIQLTDTESLKHSIWMIEGLSPKNKMELMQKVALDNDIDIIKEKIALYMEDLSK